MKKRFLVLGLLCALFSWALFWTVNRTPLPAKAQGGQQLQHLAGDVNGDGRVNLADAIYLLDYLFGHGPPPVGCAAQEETPRERLAFVQQVIDGDTIVVEPAETVRYIGINAPELGQSFAAEAKARNAELVLGKTVRLEFDQQTKDRYGRTLAYVWVGDLMVNMELVREGLARVFILPPNVKYEDQLRAAENEAREAHLGIWSLGEDQCVRIVDINYDAPGNDNVNKNGEWVEIKNQCDSPVDLSDWTLSDEAGHTYRFGHLVILPGASVFIYSGAGRDTETELYWNNPGTAVWNNDGDTAYLRDAAGRLVDTYSY